MGLLGKQIRATEKRAISQVLVELARVRRPRILLVPARRGTGEMGANKQIQVPIQVQVSKAPPDGPQAQVLEARPVHHVEPARTVVSVQAIWVAPVNGYEVRRTISIYVRRNGALRPVKTQPEELIRLV